VGSSSVEDAVKSSYERVWAGQKENKSKKSASPSLAHEALLKELKPTKGMKVLDIGSGNGETVLTIAEKVRPEGKAVGIDFTHSAVDLAKKKASQRKLDKVAEFHQGNALELPFTDNSFDAVISECVVCLIQDKQKAINEKVRVLKPDGRVIMHDVITWAPMPEVMRKNEKLYCGCIGGAVSLSEYVEMMKKAGLTDIKTVDLTKNTVQMLNTSIIANGLALKDDKEFQDLMNFVRKGGIGYALLAGTKRRN
jgi:SAM-dependent methyltransferase